MRTPAIIRWPGKIASGGVSDELVADLDIYPIVANFVGGKGYADKPEVFMAKCLRVTGFLTETHGDT